jgi:hypothetical protein
MYPESTPLFGLVFWLYFAFFIRAVFFGRRHPHRFGEKEWDQAYPPRRKLMGPAKILPLASPFINAPYKRDWDPSDRFMEPSVLEDCRFRRVKICYSTKNGIQELSGWAMAIWYPWSIHLGLQEIEVQLPGQEAPFPGMLCRGVGFASLKGGIVSIEVGERVIYSNPEIPVPFPELNMGLIWGRVYVNALRSRVFGPEFQYDWAKVMASPHFRPPDPA